MQRDKLLYELNNKASWDLVVIGGGATGLGIALDASTRGLKTLLVEKRDFSSGTSSRSTKLIHGGVRYLKQLRFSLIVESLRERKILLRNSSNVTHIIPFIIPVYSFYEKLLYSFGLHLYALFGFNSTVGNTKVLSKKETLEKLPFVNERNLCGGVLYYDAQFNDSQLCVDLAQTAINNGATVLNYCEVTDLIKSNNLVCGVVFRDTISNTNYNVSCGFVVNATGVFTEDILKKDVEAYSKIVVASQGIHLVLDSVYGSKKFAMTVPSVDGRVVFLIPWLGKLLLGTTDTKMEEAKEDPVPLKSEIDFLIDSYNRFSSKKITTNEVSAVFAGLRPLFNSSSSSTAVMSREHSIFVGKSGLITIIGGKWTTYRKMAESTVDLIYKRGRLNKRKCVTKNLLLYTYKDKNKSTQELITANPSLAEIINTEYGITKADIVYAILFEMAQTVEDVLARRTRLLFLDVRASVLVSPVVADLLAVYLKKDAAWVEAQLLAYKNLAEKYYA